MTSVRPCPQCGRALPSDAPSGVCPQCLLGVGMTAAPPETQDLAGNFIPPKPGQLSQHFPQLEILDLVGHGGMGAVYKARQRGLDRLVALKILPPEAARDPSFAERFSREARALAKLGHPHIVTVHDSGCAGGHYYVLMEYVDGVNLRDAIQTNELTPEEALAIVPQICEALQYAHDEGVVHRDIKPENILLDKKGAVKIADFGLARLLNQAPDNFTLTGTHQVMGTPKYMAPEQMEGSHEVDHRADIFSLGVVFYEMLTGELPLGRFDAPSKKVQLDVRLDEIVLRTLEKEPDRRYQTASEIKQDVETIHGPASLPPHARHYYGYEYRSKATLFGWPLIHVSHGVDPRTQRKRVAKGVIAIGDTAVGALAFGGLALGGVTFGGVSIGLCSFGGAALGLLLALGGATVSLGGAIGGLAVGTFAVGGGAFGIWGNGDQGAVIHRLAISDDFKQLFVLLTMVLVGIAVVGFSIVSAIARRHAPQSSPPKVQATDRSHTKPVAIGCAMVALVVLLSLSCVIPLTLFWSYSAREQALAADAHAQATIAARNVTKRRWEDEEEVGYNAGYWVLEAEGPTLTSRSLRGLLLREDQVPKINQVFHDVWASYLEIEKSHTTESAGKLDHPVTVIEPFAESEIAQLEDQLWSRLDEILEIEQQKEMRRRLRVHVGEGARWSSDEQWEPGILGWGRYGGRIELWKVGTWYHWSAKIKVSSSRSYMPADRAPELPTTFRRFWREETPALPTPDAVNSRQEALAQ